MPSAADIGSESTPAPVQAERPEVARLRQLVAVIALAGWTADRLTKWWALTHLSVGHPEPHLGGLVTWNLLFNSGAAFSLGAGATIVFSVLAFVAVVVVLAVVVPRVRQRWTAVACGLALAGITGNLTDRLFRPPSFLRGEVVDFIQLPYWAVFNVADMLLTSVMILVLGRSVLDVLVDSRASRDSAGTDQGAAAKEPS